MQHGRVDEEAHINVWSSMSSERVFRRARGAFLDAKVIIFLVFSKCVGDRADGV